MDNITFTSKLSQANEITIKTWSKDATNEDKRLHAALIQARIAFSNRRKALLDSWLVAAEFNAPSMTYWAERIEQINDAEAYFVDGVRN